MFDLSLSEYPDDIADLVVNGWQRIHEVGCGIPQWDSEVQKKASVLSREIPQVLAASDYVLEQFARCPQLLVELCESNALWHCYQDDSYREKLQQALKGPENEKQLSVGLRFFRRREMIRIIWRDICRLASVNETMEDLSRLADACVSTSVHYLYQWTAKSMGTPFYRNSDRAMPLVVLGMGKLGAFELNLSSDIDLIFAYPYEGETRGGAKGFSHQEFFLRLGQKLIKALDETTAEGFVFRVDMRLRPYGGSGSLVLSFKGMAGYYEQQGREWERYALIKARPIGEDGGEGERLLEILNPFVYKRYADFGVIESLREMKSLINREILRRGNEDNIKTGRGGIREVEFIAQAFQLIKGGKNPLLQERRLLKVLNQLGELNLLPVEAVAELTSAYLFLRDVEHRIQALQDRQTQLVPKEPLARARLAWAMGFASWPEFYEVLGAHCESVRMHFDALISPPDEGVESESVDERAVDLWLGKKGTEGLLDAVANLGYVQPEDAWQRIAQLRDSKTVAAMQPVARQRLDRLMPTLVMVCGQVTAPDQALERVLGLVNAVLRRSVYLALLVENPRTLRRLAELFSRSSWISETITLYPLLLEELLDPQTLFTPPDVGVLKDELRQQLLRIPEDDFEQQMECFRQFRLSHLLRVAASDITGVLPVMKVSDYLTSLAETILQFVMELAWHQMVEIYGRPQREAGAPCDPDFIIVGYGKVGGIELSYSSDLDLVFIHDGSANLGTDGEHSIDNGVFFARLGQRIIHILSARTATGQLYEVDMRLRPSGASGLLVSSLKAFENYQKRKAWNWEHQALVRARVVAGCSRLRQKFEVIRREVLATPRNPDKLRADVLAMRDKMLNHLGSGSDAVGGVKGKGADVPEEAEKEVVFNIKQDPGGIVDIEFLVQFSVLRWSEEHPDMVRWTDNIRIIDTMVQHHLISSGDARLLTDAYLAYRGFIHRCALQHTGVRTTGDQFLEYRVKVRSVWRKMLEAV